MGLTERLRRAFLRWGRLGLAGVLVLPFAVASMLGFVWLFERGLLLVFVAASVAFVVIFRGTRLALRVWQARVAGAVPVQDDPDAPAPHAATVRPGRARHAPQPDPDWGVAEVRAYERACEGIERRLAAPVPWDQMPVEALAVVEAVATDLSRGGRGALDFTLPEALLLIDRVALRYRDFLRQNVPFSDQLSVRSMWWVWQRRDSAQAAWQSGHLVWRGVRLVVNPAVGLLREIERAVTSGLHDRLGDHMRHDAQAVLLEEIAQAAVDLYSGRLRFSDAELLELQLGPEALDRARLIQPDAPVRIVLVGQVSAGKSTLVNALLEENVSETDMAPTTDAVTVHEFTLADVPCKLVDTPGLDGSEASQSALVDEMTNSDIVLWVVRANRSARAPDVGMMAAFDARMAKTPERRRPPILTVATASDLLIEGWPFPEHRLPDAAVRRIGDAMGAIHKDLGHDDLGGGPPIPVCAETPVWNIDMVNAAIEAAIPDALMVQRNRLRLGAGKGGLDLAGNLGRAARGAKAGARYVGGRLWGHRR